MGNVRLSYFKNAGGSAEVLEENNFYPFGLKHEGYNKTTGNHSYNYQYNGKELQKETGWSDYGARMYMSDIGRWGVIDPLAEQMRRYSPYTYAYNNPIRFIDPDGMKPQTQEEEISNTMAPTTMLMFYASGGSTNNRALMDFVGQPDRIGDFFVAMDKLQSVNSKSGGGGSSAGSMTFTDPSMIAFIQQGVSQSGFISGLFSMVEQLEKAGFKDPANTKAKFGDYVDLIEKVPELNKLFTLTNPIFVLVEATMFRARVPGMGRKVEVNKNSLGSVLQYAFDIGHEMNHVYDNFYNLGPVLDILPRTAQRTNVFTIFSEFRAYSWESRGGKGNDPWKNIEYTKSQFPAAYQIFVKYFREFKNNPKITAP